MDKQRAAAQRICETLHAAGHEALLAGGCVRDLLLGVPPKDFDIATSARPEQVLALFPRTIAVGAAFGVVLVCTPEGQFEVATFRQDGPYLDGRRPSSVTFVDAEADAARRDFTINALFLDPRTGAIRDFVGGRRDLEEGIVRTVGNPEERFREDHLRLLRAVRFAARLGYGLAPETETAMRRLAHLATRTSAERIRDELVKMLTEGASRVAFELMDRLGLLAEILPELMPMHGCEQPPQWHPEGDVFVHTMIMLGLYDELGIASPTLAMGLLLHDVGKPPTAVFHERWRFPEHEKVGAEMARAICQRLRFSNEATERIVWLVAQHMRFATIPDMREAKRKRFVRETGFDELSALCRIDCLASHNDLSIIRWVLDYLHDLALEGVRPKPLLTGRDLIAMGYTPGPRFAEILHTLEDLQLDGELCDAAQARAYVQANWPKDSACNLYSDKICHRAPQCGGQNA